MSKNYPEIADSLNEMLTKLHKRSPDTMRAFSSLAGASTKAGALDTKTKELVALGIAIAVRCDGCIAFHVQKLVKLGVTEDEFTETLNMSVYMGGGPSLMYAAEALRAYEQFSQ